MLIDFTDLPKRKKCYSGANGNKICVVYNDSLYMLKFPPVAEKAPDMSYTHSCFSEYIGCHIFSQLGIPAQETLLGIYKVEDKIKIVVACKDFTDFENGIVLQDFASLKNQVVATSRNGYGTELEDVLNSIHSQNLIDSNLLSDRFWDMFIVDAYIGNWDRHNGNWGLLYNAKNDTINLAPVYDCGSSLYPQISIEKIAELKNNKGEMNHRIYNIPTSSLLQSGKRINYFSFISSLSNDECNRALKRIVPKINQNEINQIVDETPFMKTERKEFIKTILTERKEKILDFSLNKLLKQEQKQNNNNAKPFTL